MYEPHRQNNKYANAALRGLLRLVVGIVIGIISAKRHDWLIIINKGGSFIFIEAVLTFIIIYIKVHRDNKLYQDILPNLPYVIANKVMWQQVFLSTLFIGVVATLTKLITNIFV